MFETRTTESDSATSVRPESYSHVSNVPWYVTRVEVLPNFKLFVQFIDGTSGTVEMRELIFSETAGVFRTLRDEKMFANVAANDGDVIWANGLDLAPDAMYDEFRLHGVWILRGKP